MLHLPQDLRLTLKLLVVAFITTQRQLIHDRTASRVTWNQSYDFVIVGAGTAGCTVAKRLTEDPNVKVLLLEAGGAQDAIYNDIPAMFSFIDEDRPNLLWNYTNVPQAYAGRQYPEGRIPERKGKTIGGTSTINAMNFIRGHRLIFDQWADEFGAVGWSYRDVLPYFKRFENNTDPQILAMSPGYHGTSGPVQVSTNKHPPEILKLLLKTYDGLGIPYTDFNGPNQLGAMIPQQFIGQDGVRASNGNAYVDPNPHPNNLHIVTEALVTRVLFRQLKAIGVEFDRKGHKYKVFANKEVIVSGGAINTPQLLMLSGVGPRYHLQSLGIPVVIDLPVGNHFMNQPVVEVDVDIVDQSLRYTPVILDVHNLAEYYFSTGVSRLAVSPYVALYYFSWKRVDSSPPNALLFVAPSPNGTQLQFIMNFVGIRSYGTIRLQNRSPYTEPLIDPNFFGDPRDFEDTVDAMRFVFYLLEKSSFAQYLRSPDLNGCPSCDRPYIHLCTETIECFVRNHTSSTLHSSGGCRLGSVDRPDVVVDPSLRVKYAQNLRVCDASVFPIMPNANPNACANMVGEKCAQIIKDSYQLSS